MRALLIAFGLLIAPLSWERADAAEVRVILVGVSNYRSEAVPDLRGPANDLRAMEALVRRMGATDITVLRDGGVQRSSVEAAIQKVGLRAKPGDWVMFYFSGHGAQARASTQRGQGDEYDQFLLLTGFDPVQQDPEDFIVDKDFTAWMGRYVPRETRIFMMIDSCHSGTMHRAIDPRAFGFAARLGMRNAGDRAIELIARPGPQLPPLADSDLLPIMAEKLPNLLYLGASRDDQLALETELPGAGGSQRGVLTYAFEQALTAGGLNTGAVVSDFDGDGAISVLELTSYINSQVRMLSAQRQESSADFPTGWEGLTIFSQLPVAPAPPENRLLVSISGGSAEGDLDAQRPWQIAPPGEDADFYWMRSTDEVLRPSGDVVATGIEDEAALTGVIDKWHALITLRPHVSERSVRLALSPAGGDHLYPSGSTVKIELARDPRARTTAVLFLTVFNMASDGTVQLLYPLAPDGEGLLDQNPKTTLLETQVVTPLGADHIVALATTAAPDLLRAALRERDGKRAAAAIAPLVLQSMKASPRHGSLSIVELYTGR